MAPQNVCRYFKFGHCKFSDNCKFMHVKEKCENLSCEIWSCSLRHPKKCKYFREFKRCKFGEWCSFDHTESNGNQDSINAILEKLENLSKIISEKDDLIRDLAQKMDKLENLNNCYDDTTATENVLDDSEMNATFLNPSYSFPCDVCEFIAKSKAGLQSHVKAKHKKIIEEPEIIVVSESVETENFECEICKYVAENNQDLDNHIVEKHNENREIKLEVFLLVGNENDVHEARKMLMEKLNEQKEVVKVEKVYVDKNDTFIDKDNLRWNSVDIVLSTKENENDWKDKKFRRNIFSKCFLWQTYEDESGEYSRENLNFRKEQKRLSEMRSRGYLV